MSKKEQISPILKNPFKHVAQGLSVSDQDDVWEEEPVSIQEFIESPEYCDQKFDGKRGCRPKIMEIAKAIVEENVREVMLLLGKGSGKDYISSLVLLYLIYRCLCMRSPQKYHNLAPGSSMYFVNVARNENQAKNVFFAEFKGHLDNCAWFTDKYEIQAQKVQFDKNIAALSGNSQAFGWLGYNTIAWVGDELAFFLTNDGSDEDDGKSKAQECWEAAYGSCQTRFPNHYKMIGITTPRFDDDFVMQKFHQLTQQMQEDNTAFTAQAATWDIHPLLTIEDFRRKLNEDYRRTMRDFGAQPMGVIETFWGDPNFMLHNVCSECKQCPIYKSYFDDKGNLIKDTHYDCWDYDGCTADAYRGNGEFREWFVIDTEADYFMHFDLSKNKDKTGFTLTHIVDYLRVEMDMTEKIKLQQEIKERGGKKEDIDMEDHIVEKPLIKTDFIGWIHPASKRDPDLIKNREIYYQGIINKIVKPLIDRGCNIVKVTMDQFQSHYFKQTLEDMGIECEILSLDRTDEVPVTGKEATTENRVIYSFNPILCREARHLKYVNGKKVDHPTGEGKDIIDSYFGAVYNAETFEGQKGLFFGVDMYDDDDDEFF